MNDQIFRLEELIYEHKGITELIYALSSLQGGVIKDYIAGITLLANLSLDNNAELNRVYQEMLELSNLK